MNDAPQEYGPEMWAVEKDVIYAATPAIEAGLEYARECLAEHDRSLGRTTRKNKVWAETIENDIREMEKALQMLRALRSGGANPSSKPSEPCSPPHSTSVHEG